MSIPRGFTLVFDDLAAHRWSWEAQSMRAVDEPTTVVTTILAERLIEGTGDRARLFAVWRDGSWATGFYRHPDDPVPVGIGSLQLRKVLRGEQAPRWKRPDLNAPRKGSKVERQDEGTPAAQRWSPVIEAGAQAGMDRIAHYNRTREWPS